ncbi:hypothetical protein BDZ97DRAFT_1821646 [Flammula alnicola]|nr:hypothetical protein BDZ97DRAFT_1821646 [Flammula alnicola]
MHMQDGFKCVNVSDDGSLAYKMDHLDNGKAINAGGDSSTGEQVHWDAFLASLDDKGASDALKTAGAPLQHHQQHHEITTTSSAGLSPSDFTTPRPGPPSPTADTMFGMNLGNMGIFDMSFVGVLGSANSWFSGSDNHSGDGASTSSASASGEDQQEQGSRGQGMNMAAGPGVEGYNVPVEAPSPAASTGGTSTLSFALG